MTEPAKGSQSERRVGSVKPYLWALAICWLLPVAVVLLGYLFLSHEVPPGQCEGIGFGCVMSPADELALLVALASPVPLGAGVVAVLVIAIVQRRRSRRH